MVNNRLSTSWNQLGQYFLDICSLRGTAEIFIMTIAIVVQVCDLWKYRKWNTVYSLMWDFYEALFAFVFLWITFQALVFTQSWFSQRSFFSFPWDPVGSDMSDVAFVVESSCFSLFMWAAKMVTKSQVCRAVVLFSWTVLVHPVIQILNLF